MTKKAKKRTRKLGWVVMAEEQAKKEKAVAKTKKAAPKSKPKKVEKVQPKVKERKIVSRGKAVEVEDKRKRTMSKKEKEAFTKEFVQKLMDKIKSLEKQLAQLAQTEVPKETIKAKAIAERVPGQLEIPIMQRSQPSVELKYDGKQDKLSWNVKVYDDKISKALGLAIATHNELMDEDEDE